MKWYYSIKGQRQGPIETEELRGLIRDGRLGPKDYVWSAGMGKDWKRVADVPEIQEPAAASEPAEEKPAEAEPKTTRSRLSLKNETPTQTREDSTAALPVMKYLSRATAGTQTEEEREAEDRRLAGRQRLKAVLSVLFKLAILSALAGGGYYAWQKGYFTTGFLSIFNKSGAVVAYKAFASACADRKYDEALKYCAGAAAVQVQADKQMAATPIGQYARSLISDLGGDVIGANYTINKEQKSADKNTVTLEADQRLRIYVSGSAMGSVIHNRHRVTVQKTDGKWLVVSFEQERLDRD